MSSSNRKPYETANALTQAFLDFASDNLSNQIELIVDIEAPDGSIIRASDRNKYVGEHFYEALTTFPDVARTIGEFLGQGIVFSEMQFELSNVDGRFNKYLPGGASFAGWVGRLVTVKIGLRDVESSYVQIFKGAITEEGGFSRTVKSIIIKARDVLEKINVSFPSDVFSSAQFPKINDDLVNSTIPVIYGDFTVNVLPRLSSVPAYVVNGGDIYVTGESIDLQVTLSPDVSTPVIFTAINHKLEVDRQITIESDNPSFPASITGTFYITNVTANEFTIGNSLGGPSIVETSGDVTGNHDGRKPDAILNSNVACVISANTNTLFDTDHVFVKRSESYYQIPHQLIKNVSANKNAFEIQHNDSAFQIDGENFIYSTSDEIFVRVKGKNIPLYSDNAVAIAQDILITYGGLTLADFDSSWSTYMNKATPATGAIYHWKARAHVKEPQNAMEFAVSLLEQVRVELFVNRSQKIALKALHWDEFDDNPSFKVSNWDVEKDSLSPQLDDRNNFNRCRAVYSFLPDLNDNAFSTPYFRNNAAISQAGKEITKLLVYPNLYNESDVQIQVQETMKLVSAYREIVVCSLTTRAILKDLGEWITLDVMIGSTVFENVPCQIRDIAYSPSGLKLPVKLWSFAMMPFGSWNPAYAGIVGGEYATITQE